MWKIENFNSPVLSELNEMCKEGDTVCFQVNWHHLKKTTLYHNLNYPIHEEFSNIVAYWRIKSFKKP